MHAFLGSARDAEPLHAQNAHRQRGKGVTKPRPVKKVKDTQSPRLPQVPEK